MRHFVFQNNIAGFSIRLFYYNLSVQICHYFLLLFLSTVCIDIHGCLNIRMPHDGLDYLQIEFILTQSCTESITYVMYAEFR